MSDDLFQNITESTRILSQKVTTLYEDVSNLIRNVSNSTYNPEDADEIANNARTISENAHIIARKLLELDYYNDTYYEELTKLSVNFSTLGNDSQEFASIISNYIRNNSNEFVAITDILTEVDELYGYSNRIESQVSSICHKENLSVTQSVKNPKENTLSTEETVKLTGELAALSTGSGNLFHNASSLSENAANLHQKAITLVDNIVNPSENILKILNDAKMLHENSSVISNSAAQLNSLSHAISEDSANPNANMFMLLLNTARLAITALTVSVDAELFSVKARNLSDFAKTVSKSTTDQFRQSAQGRKLLVYTSGNVNEYIENISEDAAKISQQAFLLSENARNISENAYKTKETASGDSGNSTDATVEPPPEDMAIDPNADPLLSPYQFGVSLASCYGWDDESGDWVTGSCSVSIHGKVLIFLSQEWRA